MRSTAGTDFPAGLHWLIEGGNRMARNCGGFGGGGFGSWWIIIIIILLFFFAVDDGPFI